MELHEFLYISTVHGEKTMLRSSLANVQVATNTLQEVKNNLLVGWEEYIAS